MRISTIAALLAPLLLLASTALAYSTYAPGSLDAYFTIDWKLVPGPRGETIEGFVYNRANQPTDRMRLSIEALDGSGQIVGRSTTWVLGGVPPNNRTWFSTPAPATGAASYRIEILSFDWVGRGA
jgi:hypothetical protein